MLVLANVLFFAWTRHDASSRSLGEENPLKRQVDPDKLKIVPRPASAVAADGCLEWGSFTPTEYARAEKALEPLALGNRMSTRRSEEIAGWWVYLPPQGNRQEAVRRAGELKALGITDYFIVTEESDFRWALSLGIYRTQEAAQARLAAVQGQGVTTAIVSARHTLMPKLWLQVKGVDPALESRFRDIARQMQGSELRGCS
jgi:hypothetical protein